MDGNGFPGDLCIFTGRFTGGMHLISYLLPLTLGQAFTTYLVGNPWETLIPPLCSLDSNRQMFMEETAPPRHLADLMEFRWQERRTYGKPITDCIRNDLLSPRLCAIFHLFCLGHYLSETQG